MNDEPAQHDQVDEGSTVRLLPSRYSWRDLDKAQTAQLWAELIDWAEWLRQRYQLGSRVPACWYRHAPVVEELSALMAAHTAAYWCEPESVDLPREDMTAWHTQWLWPMIERLTRISDFSACRPHHCRFQSHPQAVHAGVGEYVTTQLGTWTPRSGEPEARG